MAYIVMAYHCCRRSKAALRLCLPPCVCAQVRKGVHARTHRCAGACVHVQMVCVVHCTCLRVRVRTRGCAYARVRVHGVCACMACMACACVCAIGSLTVGLQTPCRPVTVINMTRSPASLARNGELCQRFRRGSLSSIPSEHSKPGTMLRARGCHLARC